MSWRWGTRCHQRTPGSLWSRPLLAMPGRQAEVGGLQVAAGGSHPIALGREGPQVAAVRGGCRWQRGTATRWLWDGRGCRGGGGGGGAGGSGGQPPGGSGTGRATGGGGKREIRQRSSSAAAAGNSRKNAAGTSKGTTLRAKQKGKLTGA